LLVDKNSTLAEYRTFGRDNYRTWCEMNLIIAIDYSRNTFEILKNRWGTNEKDIPLDLLATFLYNPAVTDARELNMLRIEHNNLFAYTGSEQ
jgi:hypothetical protein